MKELIEKTSQWHHDRNLIDGATSKDQVLKLIQEVGELSDSVCKGEDVTLVGFGTLCVRHRKARAGRNPKTGESLHIKASKVVAFKAGKTLKDAVQKE